MVERIPAGSKLMFVGNLSGKLQCESKPFTSLLTPVFNDRELWQAIERAVAFDRIEHAAVLTQPPCTRSGVGEQIALPPLAGPDGTTEEVLVHGLPLIQLATRYRLAHSDEQPTLLNTAEPIIASQLGSDRSDQEIAYAVDNVPTNWRGGAGCLLI